jgi:hypothetical protein
MVEAGAHEAATGAASPAGSPGFRFIAGAARALEKSSGAAEAANAFKATETGTAPGSLLDQLI